MYISFQFFCKEYLFVKLLDLGSEFSDISDFGCCVTCESDRLKACWMVALHGGTDCGRLKAAIARCARH